MSFRSLGLKPELARAVADEGYDTPTPIQKEAIPVILEGRDLLAGAQTGTGKTAGFTLPLLQLLHESAEGSGHSTPRTIRALILTPTRELAAQVEQSVKTYGRHLPLRSTAVFGGVGIVPQKSILRKGVDILVATPGRLLDHLSQKTVNLSHVEILVLDEADRMLDMGFIRDIRKILAALPRDRQNLLFSATFPTEIKQLATEFLRSPAMVQAPANGVAPELVAQLVHPVDRGKKRDLLSHLIRDGRWKQVLVFTRTKRGANQLALQLAKDGITTLAIHGNKSQGARTKALADFKRGSIRVLVATDLAARGLDIDQLPHVVNYELSHVPEDYVHRIGRTGRAGNDGTAISLVCQEEQDLLRGIERLLKRTIPSLAIQGYEPNPSQRREPERGERIPSGGGKARGERPGMRKKRGSKRPDHARHDGTRRSAPSAQPAGPARPAGGSRPHGVPRAHSAPRPSGPSRGIGITRSEVGVATPRPASADPAGRPTRKSPPSRSRRSRGGRTR